MVRQSVHLATPTPWPAVSPRVTVQMYPCALGLQPTPPASQGGGLGPHSRKPLLACWTPHKGPWAQLGAPRSLPWGRPGPQLGRACRSGPQGGSHLPTVLNPGMDLWGHRTTGGFQLARYGLLPGLHQAVACPSGQKLLEVCVFAPVATAPPCPGFAVKWAFGMMCHGIKHSVDLPVSTGGLGHACRCLGTSVATG